MDWTCCGLGEMKEFGIKSQQVKHKQALFLELFPFFFFLLFSRQTFSKLFFFSNTK